MAQKRRADAEAALPKRRVWNIAVYIRLSREDACCPDESESVANQRKIIEAHIAGLREATSTGSLTSMWTTAFPAQPTTGEAAFSGCSQISGAGA